MNRPILLPLTGEDSSTGRFFDWRWLSQKGFKRLFVLSSKLIQSCLKGSFFGLYTEQLHYNGVFTFKWYVNYYYLFIPEWFELGIQHWVSRIGLLNRKQWIFERPNHQLFLGKIMLQLQWVLLKNRFKKLFYHLLGSTIFSTKMRWMD